jgi:hypothetical protein
MINSRISPELVAEKLAALADFQTPNFARQLLKHPRLRDLLWFIQWQSFQSGGLPKFCEWFLENFGHNLGTPAMRQIGKTDGRYAVSELEKVIDSFPREFQPSEWESKGVFGLTCDDPSELQRERECRRERDAFMQKQPVSYFCGLCKEIALNDLVSVLHSFCTRLDATLPEVFYFENLIDALIDAMDLHAAARMESLAQTAVTRETIRALEFARHENALVKITGDTRFGKSETVSAYAEAYPWLVRVVKTPCSNNDHDLILEVARAQGVLWPEKKSRKDLKNTVEFIARYSGLMFIWDEAHYLWPQRYTRTSPPMRLNWIRSVFLDNGIPCALVTTPQTFDALRRKFTGITGYNVDQFNGRISRDVNLPDHLSESDLRAVVKVKFADMQLSEQWLQRIIGHALTSSSYLFAVEKICKNTRESARQAGRSKIVLADLEQGIIDAGFNVARRAAPASPASPANPPAKPQPRTAPPEIPARRATVPADAGRTLSRASSADILSTRRETSPVLTETL